MAYHGGSMPESEDEIAHEMARWGQWMDSLGTHLVVPGAPVGKSKTLSATGVTDDGGSNPLSGYSIVEAANIDAALDLIKACPHLDDGTIEVAPLINMGGK